MEQNIDKVLDQINEEMDSLKSLIESIEAKGPYYVEALIARQHIQLAINQLDIAHGYLSMEPLK